MENTFQMLVVFFFFLRSKLFLQKNMPSVTCDPSWSSPETSTNVEACPHCPQFVSAAQEYDSDVTGQWCNAVSPCGSRSPLLLNLGLWEGVSPKACEPAGGGWLQQCPRSCLTHLSLSRFSCVSISTRPGHSHCQQCPMSVIGAKAEVPCFNSQNLKYGFFISDVQFSSTLGINSLSAKIFHPKEQIK